MTIDRLGPIEGVPKFNKSEKNSRPEKSDRSDSISVSKEAKDMSEFLKVSEDIKNTPDIRMDRVNEVKEKLKDPSYINNKVIEAVADSILDIFKL